MKQGAEIRPLFFVQSQLNKSKNTIFVAHFCRFDECWRTLTFKSKTD